MNYTRILICILIMALVTYLPRMLPLAIFRKKIENQFVKSFLAYVPYAVLAAMTFPQFFLVFYRESDFRIGRASGSGSVGIFQPGPSGSSVGSVWSSFF